MSLTFPHTFHQLYCQPDTKSDINIPHTSGIDSVDRQLHRNQSFARWTPRVFGPRRLRIEKSVLASRIVCLDLPSFSFFFPLSALRLTAWILLFGSIHIASHLVRPSANKSSCYVGEWNTGYQPKHPRCAIASPSVAAPHFEPEHRQYLGNQKALKVDLDQQQTRSLPPTI